MLKHQKKLYISILITIFFAIFIFSLIKFFVISSFEKEENLITTPNPLLLKEGAKTITYKPNPPLLSEGGVRGGNSVTVSAGDIKINLQPNTTFYDALVQAKNTGTITFSGKNYPGLGFFVTEIGTLRAGGGKNLLYYINGKQAYVGVSSYTLKDGDVIEWKLE